jgi:hypothetical protein
MIGLSLLSSVNKHTMWSYYDWVYCCCRPSVNIICGRTLCLLTDDNNDNPIIIPPNIVLTDGRQQRQSNHNTTTYCVHWSVNTICGRIMIGLSISSVSKHNMWSYYDWVYCCCRPSVNTICGHIMIGLSLLSSVSKHNMWSYYDWVVHNTTTYCVY